jgi:hypothetical protein
MIRGTTPTLLYNLPFTADLIKSAEITIQYIDDLKKVLILKKLEDCTLGENTISARLTQEETLQLPAPSFVYVQLRVVLKPDDTILATEPQVVTVKNLLAEDVIE